MSKALSPIMNIAKYTIADEIRQRSFIVIFAVSVIFVFLIRGCYQGNYMVNGQELEAAAIVGTVSKITFHIITVIVMLIAALLSMRVFKRDRDEGMQSCVFSKSITRRQYVVGKIFGLWALSSFFMLVLHSIILITVYIKLNVAIPGYLAASLLCSFNLLFVIIAVLLFALLMPDIAAFLVVMAISVISYVADGIFAISHSPMAQTMMNQTPPSEMTGWKVVYYLWPKISGTQNFAVSFISGGEFSGWMSVYPLINIIVYCFVLGALLFWRFRNEDIL
jgi:ABC-type transport system involved in multi-copper enzyme maturation permease subunit